MTTIVIHFASPGCLCYKAFAAVPQVFEASPQRRMARGICLSCRHFLLFVQDPLTLGLSFNLLVAPGGWAGLYELVYGGQLAGHQRLGRVAPRLAVNFNEFQRISTRSAVYTTTLTARDAAAARIRPAALWICC